MHYTNGETKNIFSLTETGVVMKIGIKFTSMWNTTELKLIGIYWHLYCNSETVGQYIWNKSDSISQILIYVELY